MKKSIHLLKKVTQLLTLILLCLAFSCQQLGKETITEEKAKALIDIDDEIWNEGNLDLIDEFYPSDFVIHEVDISEDLVGIDAYKEYVTDTRTMCPDYNCTLEEIIVKDDKIVARYTVTGTNTGQFGDLPPTGKKLRISVINIFRVANGKLAEVWIYYNLAAVLQQLGYTITPPQG